jgi:hypothetical protein
MFELSMKRPTQAQETDEELVSRIVDQHNGSRGSLIAILEKIQSEHGWTSTALLLSTTYSTSNREVSTWSQCASALPVTCETHTPWSRSLKNNSE